MPALIVQGLPALAKFLDKLVPLQGGRTYLIAALTIGGNIFLFLTGQVTGEQAASTILTAGGLSYAALHKTG